MSIGTVGAIALIGGSALVGGAASVIGAGKQADAADKSTQANLAFQREGLEYQKQQAGQAYQLFREQQGQFEPFRQSQLRALGLLEGLSDPNSAGAEQERGMATQAIQRQLAAQGLLRSGTQSNQLQTLELGLADKRKNILGMLAGTGAGAQSASFGMNSANQMLSAGNQIGSSISQMGQTAGAGIMASGNAAAQGFAGVNNAFQGGLGNYMQYAMLNKMYGKA